jgi:hypothetical protein
MCSKDGSTGFWDVEGVDIKTYFTVIINFNCKLVLG